ncbi:unnamed protein product [Calicophoron daubneyi]|uniref:Uncharacterized protein n=1 Tax=Calicophoron daubneyi TaxID=300641 RepID=A0AAV2TBB7_CALDB
MTCCSPALLLRYPGFVGSTDVDPSTAHFVLHASMQKLDQARRSRGGIKLHQGLLIAVTALKAKQILSEPYFSFPLTMKNPKLSADSENELPPPNLDRFLTPTQSFEMCTAPSPKIGPIWPSNVEDTEFEYAKNDLSYSSGSELMENIQTVEQAPTPCFAPGLGRSSSVDALWAPTSEFDGLKTTDACSSGPFKRSCLDDLLVPDHCSDMMDVAPLSHIPELKRPCLEIG